MSHERKKDGHRKDKKMARMRADIAERKAAAKPKHFSDQHDVQSYKPGGPSDDNRDAGRQPGS